MKASHCPTTPKSRLGRPPISDEERTRRILQAAEKVFTTVGYGAAAMEEIARTAGMAKKTLYALYPDKASLLAALTVAADDFPWEDANRAPLSDPVEELRHRLVASIEFALTPRQLRLTRLLIAEAERAPSLADNFHDRVMVKCQTYLIAAVERVEQAGVGPRIDDVRETACALLGASLAELHLTALLGSRRQPDHEEILARVNAALRICGFGGQAKP